MKKLVLTLAAAALIAPVAAKAEDAANHEGHPALEAAADATVVTEVTIVEKELADGTKVSIEGTNVFVVGADGVKTAAPDGTHTFKDGTTATTKDGLVVAE